MEQITNAQITGWSVPLLLANNNRQMFSCAEAQLADPKNINIVVACFKSS